MEVIEVQKAWLEACLAHPDAIGKEQRHERRMKEDYDWTGVIVERFCDKQVVAELARSGVTVFITDEQAKEAKVKAEVK
ncbi:hypothetical protein [Synechococcus sp. WH 8016]|uniref:hypothetical protein n=1 Tax=Synechococcus sp. WH 8016 TaxID=166318 RepID=UPI00022DA193|nr:hypothetical protein [Synechococcus sp. WH 8016]EHA64085.1 hypothetical protein Syn8016DRAFT_1127 [Synechococcus sp. WH 8016]